MRILFKYRRGEELNKEMGAVPRLGDLVVIDGMAFEVRSVTWLPEFGPDEPEVRVYLEGPK